MNRLRDWLYLLSCALLLLGQARVVTAQPSPGGGAPSSPTPNDVSADPAVRYGMLANGMRYAIMRNQLPPGAAAIQMVYDFGSIHEAENEKGLAHFIEHMVFNGTTRVPEGELMKMLERLGLAMGADANAMTDYYRTHYMLNLNRATEAALDESLFLLREMASEATFAPDAIERERGIVVSEWRESRGPMTGWLEATIHALAPGSLVSKRLPIGEREIIESAPRERLVSLYERYYRPERATLVVVGDFDVASMQKKIEARFADWKGKGVAGTDPEPYRLPERPTTAYVYSHPSAPDVVRLVATTPLVSMQDSVDARRGGDLMTIALRSILRRLSPMIHLVDAPFLDLAASFGPSQRAVNTVSIGAATKPGGQKVAIEVLEKEWRRAVRFGFTRQELDAAIAELRAQHRFLANRESTRYSVELNANIVNSLSEGGALVTPSWELARFERVAAEVTPALMHAAVREWMGQVEPIIIAASSLTTGPGYEAELVQTFRESQKAEVEPPVEKELPTFAYTNFGAPGKVVSDARLAGVDARLIAFANNVRLTIKQTPYQKNLIYASVRIGHGTLDLPSTPVGLGSLVGQLAEGGLEKHSAEELMRMFPGRQVDPRLVGFLSSFGGGYSTNPDDLLLQLQLAAAFTVAPGFRPEAERAWRSRIEQGYPRVRADSSAVWWNQAQRLLASGDTRWGFDPLDRAHERTFAELKPLVMPVLAKGPVEIAIVGDVDEQRAIDAVAQTFGALPERAPPDGKIRDELPVVFRQDKTPISLTHDGEPTDARATVVWPVAVDPDRDPRAAQVVRLMSTVMGRKVIEEVREALGVAYSPMVYPNLSENWPGYNHIEATVNADPAAVDVAIEVVREIAARMRAGDISDDELARAVQPQLDALAAESSDNVYWITLLDQAQSRPERTERLQIRAQEAELRSITKADIVAAANTFLTDRAAQEVRIVPSGRQGTPSRGPRMPLQNRVDRSVTPAEPAGEAGPVQTESRERDPAVDTLLREKVFPERRSFQGAPGRSDLAPGLRVR